MREKSRDHRPHPGAPTFLRHSACKSSVVQEGRLLESGRLHRVIGWGESFFLKDLQSMWSIRATLREYHEGLAGCALRLIEGPVYFKND